MPRTWLFWDRDAALDFCRRARYPMVIKLSVGYRSNNVRLLQSASEAEYWVDQLFGPSIWSLDDRPAGSPVRLALRRGKAAARALAGRPPVRSIDAELQRGYLYLQEFLEGNEFDTRVTVIGNRAFAYRRVNRPEPIFAPAAAASQTGMRPRSIWTRSA